MNDIDAEKAVARKTAFAARKAAHATGLDAAAQAHLRAALAEFGDAPLAGYMPIRTEIDPVPVMAAHRGPVGVPVILGAGQPLAFHAWTPDCAMTDGPFGARVPVQGQALTPRAVIVPLVGFDARGYRLGYGGGFYDRTLEGLRALRPTLAIGFAYGVQEAGALPLEATDQPLDMIVTDAEVIEV